MMMRLFATAALSLALAAPAAADPVLGMWKTQPDDNGNFGHVQIYTCDAAICGVIRRAFDSAGNPVESENVGKRMIWDMQAEGNGTYSGGRIWAPDRDRTYNSKMELSGDSLEVSGCFGPICRGQTWTRAN